MSLFSRGRYLSTITVPGVFFSTTVFAAFTVGLSHCRSPLSNRGAVHIIVKSRWSATAQWPSGLITTNFYYTSGTNAGWLEKTIDYDNGTALRTNTFLSYDKGLVESLKDERNLTTTRSWDNLLRLQTFTIPTGTYSLQYTNLGLGAAIDPIGKTNRFSYDAVGRLWAGMDALSTNSVGYTCSFPCRFTNAIQQVTHFSVQDHIQRVRVFRVFGGCPRAQPFSQGRTDKH